MARQVYRPGEGWSEGKAAPERLEPELAALPSSYVTKEDADPDHVHPLDDPHIVAALTEEQQLKEGSLVRPDITPQEPEAKKVTKKKSLFQAGKWLPLSSLGVNRRQREVDLIRFKVIHSTMMALYEKARRGESVSEEDFTKPRHLYFPKDNLMNFGVRDGHAPAPQERARYLRDIDLAIDLMNWPPYVLDLLREEGVDVPSPEDFQHATMNYSPIITS